MADLSDVIVELSSSFAAAVGRAGCTLAAGSHPKMAHWLNETVGEALKKNAKAWTPSAERYVVKIVGRIADDAARVARDLHAAEITAEILDQATQEVIAEQQLVCQRWEEMAANRKGVGGDVVPLGMFCMKFRH